MAINSLSLDSSNLNIPKRQTGFTLVELSITVAIIAVLLVGTLAGVQRLLRSNNTNNTVTQTQAAVSNITKFFAATGDTTILNTNNLVTLGVWEAASVRNGAPVSPFTGAIRVASNTAAAGAIAIGGGYWYRLQNIPADACPSLALAFQSTAAGIYVTGAAAADPATTPLAANAYRVPGAAAFNLANLNASCTANANGGPVELALFFTNN